MAVTMSYRVVHRMGAPGGGGEREGGSVGVTEGGVVQVDGSRMMVWRGTMLMVPNKMTVRLA